MDFKNSYQFRLFAIVVIAVCYNGFLAFVNANIISLNYSIVALTEISVLMLVLGLILHSGLEMSDSREIILITSIVVLALIISILNQKLFIDSIRNFLVIVAFFLLGKRASEQTVHNVFFIISSVVFVFLLLEIFALDIYVQILKPAFYYETTRGFAESEYNSIGVFKNALSFEGRFSFGIFDGPRTASIFLEQVSLSNFAVILAIYIAVFAEKIQFKNKLIFISLIILILISSRSRAALALVVLVWIGYYLVPLMPKRIALAILPMSSLVAIFTYIFFAEGYDQFGDSLKGRLSLTGSLLYDIDFKSIFALQVRNLGLYGDSGLAYVINTNMLFGMIILWLYIGLITPANTNMQLRFLFLANMYFFAILTISGTSVFSIKTAALLWFLAGFLYVHNGESESLDKLSVK